MYYGFAYDDYYPSGGANDFKVSSENLGDCIQTLLQEFGYYGNLEVYGEDSVHGLVKEWNN